MRIATDKKKYARENVRYRQSFAIVVWDKAQNFSTTGLLCILYEKRRAGGGKELLHCFEISETTGKAFIVKRLVYSYVLLSHFPLSLVADSHFCDIDDNSSYSLAL